MAEPGPLYNFGVLTKRYELVSRTAGQLAPGVLGAVCGFVMVLGSIPMPLPFLPVLLGFWVALAQGPGNDPWETRCPDHRQPQTEDRKVRPAQGLGEGHRSWSSKRMTSPFDWSEEPAAGMNVPRPHPTFRWFSSQKVVSSCHWWHRPLRLLSS